MWVRGVTSPIKNSPDSGEGKEGAEREGESQCMVNLCAEELVTGGTDAKWCIDPHFKSVQGVGISKSKTNRNTYNSGPEELKEVKADKIS